ncbi:MAG: YIP1 family protein [Patescibacteria group bacterium]|nr:YIP1 family protein [Patescibacteria group bacterium]
MDKSGIKKDFQTAFRVLILDKHAMEGVSRDSQKTFMALVFLVVPTITNVVLASLTVRHFSSFHFQALLGGLVMAIVGIFLASYIAEKGFRGTAHHMGFFRVIGFASLIGWLNMVAYFYLLLGVSGLSSIKSIVSFVVGIWTLVIFYKALRYVHNLKDGDAVIVIVATIVGMLVVQGLFVKLFGFSGGLF